MKPSLLLLWCGLIGLFVAVYQYFSITGGGSSILGRVPWPLLALLLFGAFFAYFFVRTRRWVAIHDLGVSYLFAGQPERAKGQFEVALKKGTSKVHRALAEYNLGLTLLALGESEAALKVLQAVEKSQGLKFSPAYNTPLPNQLALCCALLGDIPTARQWLKEGDVRRGDRPVNFSLLPEVIVLCRDGHPAAAANLLHSRWRDAESLSVRQFKLLKLVEALALHLEEPQANQLRIQQALGAATPMDQALLQALGSRWPELRSFVQGQQLGAVAA